jgi:hypothetical protein
MTYAEAQDMLREMAGVYNYRAAMRVPTSVGRTSPGKTAEGRYTHRKKPQDPNRFDLMNGQEPSDEMIRRFMKMHTSRSAKKAQGRSAQAAGATAPAPGSSGTSELRTMMDKLAADYQAQVDKANAANEARYGEGKGELTDLRSRNQARVGNWGGVQEQLNREKADANLMAVQANLAQRGLGGATLTDAFRLRNERDLGLLQQDVSERRDDRLSRYDTSDTQNLVGFVERRTDRAPDQAPLLALSAKLGEAEAYRAGQAAMQAQQPQQRRQPQYMGGGGVSPFAAMAMQQNMGQMNPFNAAVSYFNNNQPYRWGGVVPNRYPHRKGESLDEAYARRTGFQQGY